jgi:DNA-directed RNA polymerase subunit M
MEFCEKCRAIIVLSEGKAVCPSCGYRPKKRIRIESSEKIENKESIAIIKEGSDNTYPIVQIKCEKCKNNSAYFWTTQTRSSDESETKFYKCVKCGHTRREYR